MFYEQDNVIRYKWNPKTGSGFRLRFDAQCAQRGGHGCFRVEDWSNHCVVDEWGCSSLDEALGVLRHFFELDVYQESNRLQARLSGHA
ncbi:MAG: hypothetical protein MUC77_08110 [Chromatiaceae bacterium]|jgi:hypothetical protein|nr:hypothetical protein [Chromatiaceae bacterium]